MIPSKQLSNGEKELFAAFLEIGTKKSLPDKNQIMDLLVQAMQKNMDDPVTLRPKDFSGNPGGIISLRKDIPVLIVPDIHGRSQLLISVLQYPVDGIPVIKLVMNNELQILCLGDAFHTEVLSQDNWLNAFNEYQNGFYLHEAMDREMVYNFRTLELLLQLKCHFGAMFHFLKGNHENINNDNKNGNYSFGKYAHEGEMVKEWCLKFYGMDLISEMIKYEQLMPLLAIGNHFLASHAEPEEYYEYDTVLNYRKQSEVVYGLTWTTNDRDRLTSVWKMLDTYLGKTTGNEVNIYFGGHRHISGRYHLRAGNKFVQIHNPEKYIIALIRPDRNFDLDRDIIELE